MQKKKRTPLKKQYSARHINETRNFNLMQNPFSAARQSNIASSTSKIMTKESDTYCDLSISFTNDFPEPLCQDNILTNARSSLIDLRTEAQLYLDSSRKANQRTKDSLSESMHRQSVSSTDQLSVLIQSMHKTMKKINNKLEKVNEKSNKRDEESKMIKDSIVELRDKIEEIKTIKTNSSECSHMCQII